MAKFVFIYKGGVEPETPEGQKASMKAWTDWFKDMGNAVIDAGNPFSESKIISPDTTVSEISSDGATGYTIVSAESIDAAIELAKDSPHLSESGSIEVYEINDIM